MQKCFLIGAMVALASACSGASYREIIYPSPCSDRNECRVLGWEMWGSPKKMREQAIDLCNGHSAHIRLSYPHRDYAWVRCVPRRQNAPVQVFVTLDNNFEVP